MEGGEGHEHGEQQDNGEETGDRHQTYYQDIGFLATLKKMFFGARDPESDLSVEMLEELHMVTGCEFYPHSNFIPDTIDDTRWVGS